MPGASVDVLTCILVMQTQERQVAARKTLQWRPSRALGKGNRLQVYSLHSAIPEARGLYDPVNDKDACGVGFIGEDHPSELSSLSVCRRYLSSNPLYCIYRDMSMHQCCS